jgi:hypothetical protein
VTNPHSAGTNASADRRCRKAKPNVFEQARIWRSLDEAPHNIFPIHQVRQPRRTDHQPMDEKRTPQLKRAHPRWISQRRNHPPLASRYFPER